MNPTPLEKIRAACIAANPEIEVVIKCPCKFCPKENHETIRVFPIIRLADILLAIEKADGNVELSLYGEILHIGHYEKPDREGYYTKAFWKLVEPLESQSPETLLFLSELL